MSTKVQDFLGYPLFTGKLEDIELENIKVINTINPHSYYCACFDEKFSKAQKSADLLLPDGAGIILGAKLNGISIGGRITGSDIHLLLLKRMNERYGKVFYMGASEDSLRKIKSRLSAEYPNLEMGYYSPSYSKEFDDAENRAIVDTINAFNPDVLFVGMTAPKQEKWVYDHSERLTAKHIASIGAVFDFYAGTVKRPGRIWLALHLEWFRRLIGQPKKLWRRNFISSPFFLWHVVRSGLRTLRKED